MQSLAKWIGRGLLSALLLSIFCAGNALAAPATHAIAGDGSPTDPNIKYIGRWDISSSTIHTSYWTGAYFKTDFTGTTVQIKLATAVNIYVLIDKGVDTFYSGVSGTVNLTPTPLAPGIHSLRVAAYSEHDDIGFEGLVLAPGAHTVAPTISSHLLEFVGDSITAGATTSKRALTGYGWLTGEALSVEHVLTAHGGICLVDGVQCGVPNAAGMSAQFFKEQTVYFPNSPLWDFSRYQPDAVVINLGTNDNGYHVPDATFQSTYITFLQKIRAVYPRTEILVLRTFNGYKAAPTQAAVQAVNAAGDNKVRYIDTTGWLTRSDLNDSVHPSDAGQIKVTNQLAPILAPYVGTFPANTSANYQLSNRASSKALSAANGPIVKQATWTGNTGQQWNISALGGGYYRIVNLGSGKVLSSLFGVTADLRAWTDASDQQWRLRLTPDGYYQLINRASKQALTALTSEGSAVMQWFPDNSQNQQWSITEL